MKQFCLNFEVILKNVASVPLHFAEPLGTTLLYVIAFLLGEQLEEILIYTVRNGME